MKKVLVYGKNSYIGEHYYHALKKSGNNVIIINSFEQKPKDIDFTGIDTVVNVVGIAHIKITDDMEGLFYKINTDLAVELCDVAKKAGVKQYIYMSSMNVFGDTTETISSREQEGPKNFYGKSKYLADQKIHAMEAVNNLHDIRCQLKDTLDKYKVDFWQTETCIMGNDEEIGGGGGYDFTMKTALYVARIIHHDIVYAGARSWQWWRSIGGDYKDGLIREYSDPTFLNGEVKDSKLMWALGNYSRFIRPGAVRKAIIAKDNQGKIIPEGDTDVTGLMCSAYQNTDGKEVFVMINYAAEDKEFTFYQHNGIIKNWTIYRTSDKDGENLLPVGSIKNHEKVVIPARSIITLVTQ